MNSVSAPQDIIPLNQILPEDPLLMMGAGPVPIPAAVAAANAIVINHLGPTMNQVIEQVKTMSGYVFQTNSQHILGVAGPGSAAMEMAIVNLVVPGNTVLSICNGFFSNRLAEMADRVGADVQRLHIEDGKCADPDDVKKALLKYKPAIVTLVQGETSNTVFNRHLPAIAKLVSEYGALIIVDAVCTLSTMPLESEKWGVDAVITGGQKGLASIPGVSLIAFSDKAWQHVIQRTDILHHWCLDAKLADQFWYQKAYHYTAPVSGILAIHEALRLICAESLEKRFDRHQRCSLSLQTGIEAMGLKLYVEPDSRLNSVVGIALPDHIDGPELLRLMSKRHRVEISGSFGPRIVRIGQMGEQSRTHNLFRALHALGSSMQSLGASIDLPGGVAAMESSLHEYEKSRGVE